MDPNPMSQMELLDLQNAFRAVVRQELARKRKAKLELATARTRAAQAELSLKRRTNEYLEYVHDMSIKHDQIVADLQAKLVMAEFRVDAQIQKLTKFKEQIQRYIPDVDERRDEIVPKGTEARMLLAERQVQILVGWGAERGCVPTPCGCGEQRACPTNTKSCWRELSLAEARKELGI